MCSKNIHLKYIWVYKNKIKQKKKTKELNQLTRYSPRSARVEIRSFRCGVRLCGLFCRSFLLFFFLLVLLLLLRFSCIEIHCDRCRWYRTNMAIFNGVFLLQHFHVALQNVINVALFGWQFNDLLNKSTCWNNGQMVTNRLLLRSLKFFAH